MDLQTRFITLDEFRDYTGIDLEARLKKDDNPGSTAYAFLRRCTDRVEAYIEANYHRRIEREYPNFTNYQKEKYKLGLIEQALYIFKNGDISVDSGYDPQEGEKVSRGTIERLSLAPNAKNYFMLSGVLTRYLKTKGRSGYFDDFGWWR